MTEEDDRYEDDEVAANDSEIEEVEANDSEIEEVTLEDDWTYSRCDDIILYIHLVFFKCKQYYKIDIFVVFFSDECDFMSFWN